MEMLVYQYFLAFMQSINEVQKIKSFVEGSENLDFAT